MRATYSYREDPSVPPFPDDRPVLIFDGKCVLCSRFARFIIRHDPAHRFRLLAAQTPLGVALYRHFGLAQPNYETNVLLEAGRVWLKSDGAIRIFARLGLPWSLLSAGGRIIPKALRDRLYGVVARNRLRWFGALDVCYLPDPAEADRFLS
ncbi:MAG TPA: DCC1-like thiol-disulfide oxidoreductase family protein [Caulobacteraceae bacterium]|nr:DCC1-like thiol-disulfide oxidoreductase family protein [Caulobacteraceae bacterium]